MWNRIVYGAREFVDRDILEGNCFLSNAISGEELAADTLDISVRSSDSVPMLLSDPSGLLTYDASAKPVMAALTTDTLDLFSYGAPVSYYHDGALIGQFYVTKITRIGIARYDINAISAIGILESSDHYGGVYYGETFGALARDIIGGQFAFTIAPELESIQLYGALPIDTRRNNLHQLLFSIGGTVVKNANGTMHLTPLSTAGRTAIPDERLYDVGNVSHRPAVTSVAVTEHTFARTPIDREVTLYTGDGFAQQITTPQGRSVFGALIKFSSPCHSLSLDFGTIYESGPNYAVITGDLGGTLTGLEYTHTTREITKQSGAQGAKENVLRVTDAHLVNFLNSENVVNRMLAYYAATSDVENDIVLRNERPGAPVSMVDQFGHQTDAFVQSLDIIMSRILKARASFVAGFIPGEAGNFYRRSYIITANGTFTVPAEHRGRALVVVISGGQRGYGGEDGKPGEPIAPNDRPIQNAKAGDGGAGGDGGSGGRVAEFTISIASGQAFPVYIGAGGDDFDEDGPTFGGDSYFGSFSSAGGLPRPGGYSDIITGETYATSGPTGVKGGRGADGSAPGETVTFSGTTFLPGKNGKNQIYSASVYGYGGYGGGPSAAGDGFDGMDGTAGRFEDGGLYSDGGRGGAGTSARGTPGLAATIPGGGGQGGHGGGGGGAGGYATGGRDPFSMGGLGGFGSTGGHGAPGVVIVYL